MDDLMTGISVMNDLSGNHGAAQGAQSVYDPAGAAPASAPRSTSDDILSALDQMNSAFGQLGENKAVSQQSAQPAAPQSTGYGAQQSSYGQQSAQSAAPQSTGYGAQQSGYGQQSAPQQPAPQPAKVNDMGYSSDDYKYDPRRMNYGQRGNSYGAPTAPQSPQQGYGAQQNSYGQQQSGGYRQPSSGYGGQQSSYGNQPAGYGNAQSGYGSDAYRYNPYNNYNSTGSMVMRSAESSDSDFTAMLKGILGAVIGAIPGMLLMIMVARFGFIAALCGAVMAICIFFGYKLMTGSSWLSAKVGLIICGIVMVIAVYFSVKISWTFALVDAIEEAKELTKAFDSYGLSDTYYKSILGGDTTPTFGNCWDNFGDILSAIGAKGRFVASLAENYLFAAIGAVGTFIKFGREN